jgi:hypothetical protein
LAKCASTSVSPDVHVALGREAVAHVGQVVLAADEVDVDTVRLPQLRLVGARPVGTRAHHVAELGHRLHECHCDRARWVAELHRAVDVEAHDHQLPLAEEAFGSSVERHGGPRYPPGYDPL